MKEKSRYVLGHGPKGEALALGIIGPVALLALWFAASWFGWIKPLYLPQPWRLLEAYGDIEPNILIHSLSTAGLVIVGVLIGVLLGFGIGLLLRQSFFFRSVLTPIIEAWRPVPVVAIVPFFILWFGFAVKGKIILIALGTFLIVVVGVVNSIDKLEPIYLRTALSYGATNWKFLRHAAIPAILPYMLAPLRISLAIAITLAVVSEFMGATRGLGYVINIALNNFSTHSILLCTLILGFIGGALDWVLRLIHSWITLWARNLDEVFETKQNQRIRQMNRKINFSFTVMGMATLACISLLSCKPSSLPQTETPKTKMKVRYGVSPYQDTILPIVAEKEGWYKEEGLDVELRILDWGSVMTAVASGAVDVAIQNFNSFQAKYENIAKGGGDVIFYCPFYIFRGSAIMVRGDSSLKPLSQFLKEYPQNKEKAVVETVKQLKGKTILTTKGTEMEQVVLTAMEKAGLSQKDIKIIHAQPSHSLAGFLRKEGDAFSGGVTERVEASRHGAVVLIEAADLTVPVIDGLVTTKKYAEEHPEILQKLIFLWFKTIHFLGEDLDNRALIVTEYLGRIASTQYSLEEYKYTWFNTQTYFDSIDEMKAALLNPESPSYWKKSWDRNNDFLMEEDKMEKPVPYDAFWGEKILK